MALVIGAESVEACGSNWMVKSQICNNGSTDRTVRIKQFPYDKDGKKIAKKEVTTTIPSNTCKTIVFEYPSEPKPVKSYTYVLDGGNIEANESNSLVAKSVNVGESSSGYHIVPVNFAYPWKLDEAFPGSYQGPFVLDAIQGLPAGWTAVPLRHPVGTLFDIDMNDREHPDALLLYTGLAPAEGTVATLTLVHRAYGKPDEEVYRLVQHVRLAVDTMPPQFTTFQLVPDIGTGLVEVRGNAIDTASGLHTIHAKYSTDDGEHWTRSALQRPEEAAPGENIVQSATIGPFCAGQTVRVELVAVDQLENATVSDPLSITM